MAMISLKRSIARLQTRELVVRPRRSPGVRLFVIGAALVGLIVAGGAIYNHGLTMAGFNSVSALQQNQELRDEIKRLRGENQDMREGLARAQRSLQMDQTAYQELDRSLKNSAQEIMRLREELSFYRNIISPANKVPGLRIQSLDVDRGGSDAQYHYRLVLIQALKHDRSIVGRAKLEITGTQDGKNAAITVPGPIDKPISVNFKYFQEIEGNVQFPKDFKPMRIHVSVMTGGSDPALEQTYPWPEL